MSTQGGRPDRDAALRLARHEYLRGVDIDVAAIARGLGVSRATVYRWVGTRDELLVQTMWDLTERAMSARWSDLRGVTGPRVPRLLGGYLRDVLGQPGALAFALDNNEKQMRLLTVARFGYHNRLVALVRGYLAEDLADRRFTTALGLDDLAFASVRIAESFFYLPAIAGGTPDPDGAERVLNLLMRPNDPGASS